MPLLHTLRAGVLFVLAFTVGAAQVLAGDLPDTLQKVKPSIVAVGTVTPTQHTSADFLGTGFVVGNGHFVLTNEHVVSKILDSKSKETWAVFVGVDAEVRHAKQVAEDAEHDVALLEISGEPLPALTLGDAASVREGELYAFTGFPIGPVLGLHPVTHRGIVSAITPIAIPQADSRQLNAKIIDRLRHPFNVFQLDAIAYPGNSGSPLYDPASGKVIGIVNSVYVKESKESILQKPSGIAYAIPISYASKLMKKVGQ